MTNVRLGWSNPLTNQLQSEDAPSLRLLFTSLSHWLQFPLVGLRAVNTTIPNNGTDVPWQTELYDEYQLHDANSATIRVPPAFRTYLAVGVGAAQMIVGSGVAAFHWKVNGVLTGFSNLIAAPPAGFSWEGCVPFIKKVERGQTLSVLAYQNSGASSVTNAFELWCAFLPMGAGQG